MTLEEVAARVEAATGPVKWQRGGTEFKASCPCHQDRTPSATFKLGEKGDIIAFCFGCSAKGEAIANALGMDIKEWFAQSANGTNGGGRPGRPYQAPPNRQNGAQRPALVERKPLLNPKPSRYRILDPDGNLIAVHQRIDGTKEDGSPGKNMWWELPDGTKGLGGLPTTSLPLYGCQLLRDHPDEEMPVLAEGEKAAQALIRCGLPAVGTVCGAAATPSDETLRPLTRFACVTLWPDNDEPGRAHMNRVAVALKRLNAKQIMIVETGPGPKGEDAADIADENERRARVVTAKEWVETPNALAVLGQNGGAPAVSSGLIIPWETRSQALVANEAYLKRTAVVDKLMYTSSVSLVTGGKHAGKSTLVRWLAICVAQGRAFLGREVTQGPVFYIASEDETMAARQELLNLGWSEDDPIRFLSSTDIPIDPTDPSFLQGLAEQVRAEGVLLCVLDMLFDFVRIPDEMSYAGTRDAVGKIQHVATDGGCHVVPVHHAPKNALIGDAAVAALGSQGLAARVSPIILVRRFGPGVHSISSTSVRDPRGQAIMDSRLVKRPDGSVELGGAFKATMLAEVYAPKILEMIAQEPGLEFTAPDLVEQLGLSYEVVRACLYTLFKNGAIERTGAGKKRAPFRYFISATNGNEAQEKKGPPLGEAPFFSEPEKDPDPNSQGRFGYKD